MDCFHDSTICDVISVSYLGTSHRYKQKPSEEASKRFSYEQ